MSGPARFAFTAPLWLHAGEGGWHFITLPPDVADEIGDLADQGLAKGFGSVPVDVTIGTSTWPTSVFPSRADESYVLPVKKKVRVSEGIEDGDDVAVHLEVRAQ